MNDGLKRFMLYIVVVGLCIIGSKIIFENVMASSMPDWLKWMILRS